MPVIMHPRHPPQLPAMALDVSVVSSCSAPHIHARTLSYHLLRRAPALRRFIPRCLPAVICQSSILGLRAPTRFPSPSRNCVSRPSASPIEERILLQVASSTLIGLSYPWTKATPLVKHFAPVLPPMRRGARGGNLQMLTGRDGDRETSTPASRVTTSFGLLSAPWDITLRTA